MPKPRVVAGAARRRQRRHILAELPDAIEGQIAELCRDVAVQMKLMRQLQAQADELRVVIGAWASQSERTSDRDSTDAPD